MKELLNYNSGSADEHEPELQRTVELKDTGAKAFVVIDSYLDGGGTGGIRMGESVTLEEVAGLAREMSLKFAWLNIPRGGAKSGITFSGEISTNEKHRMLEEFGTSIAGLLKSREYIGGMDLGIGPSELAIIMSAAGMQAESVPIETEIDSNFFTALTVFVSLATLLQQKGLEFDGLRVLVEGVGKVSTHLMHMIVDAGASVVGVSTITGSVYDHNGIDIEELLALKESHGDDCVSFYQSLPLQAAEELYLQQADVLIPGARANSINPGNIDEIRARFIVPIANISTSTAMEKELFDRGVAYIPGFVSNSGGIFCWYLAKLFEQSRENIIKYGYSGKIRRLIDEADRHQMPIAELARLQAQKNANRMAAERSSISRRITGMARKLAPGRSLYLALRKVLGNEWSRKDTVFCRWYFYTRYFR